MIPVILGMNNPHGPGEDLSPDDGAGARLLSLAILGGLTRRQYEDGLERRNLLSTKRWSAIRARTAARGLIPLLRGREVVVLGRAVWDALRLPRDAVFFDSASCRGATWHLVPHPSGRCLLYNDPAVRRRAAEVLREVHERGRSQ